MSTPKELAGDALAKTVWDFIQTNDINLDTDEMEQARAAYETAAQPEANPADDDLLESARREYPRDSGLHIQLKKLLANTGYNEIKNADNNPAKIATHVPQPEAKPVEDWMGNAADDIADLSGESLGSPESIAAIIAKHAPKPSKEVTARELIAFFRTQGFTETAILIERWLQEAERASKAQAEKGGVK